jgi:putative hydrolase of the HAD superfamily
MSIRAVLWDIGGVLLRTTDRRPRERFAQRLGLTPQALETLVFGGEMGTRAQMGQVAPDELWNHAGAALGLSAEMQAELRAAFFGGDTLDAALIDYVRSLRPRYFSGIISNAWNDLRPVIAARWRIADAFDLIVISGEVGWMKPDPRIFRYALDGLGVAPAEAVFIDDFAANVDGARAVGMHALQFQTPEQIQAGLKALLERLG